MFFWKRNRYALDTANKVIHHVEHARKFGEVDNLKNPFLFGFVQGTANMVVITGERRPPSNKDSGLIAAKVFQYLFRDRYMEAMENSMGFMQNMDPQMQRGLDAALIFWSLAFGRLQPEQNDTLRKIMNSPTTHARSEFLQNHLPDHAPASNVENVLIEVSARISREMAGDDRWDDV